MYSILLQNKLPSFGKNFNTCKYINTRFIASFEKIPLATDAPLPDDQIYQYKPYYKNQLKKYGQIFRNEQGVVFTANPDDFSKIFQDESNAGELQQKIFLWPAKALADKYNEPMSLFDMDDSEFNRRKESIKKGMLYPKGISKLTSMFNDVTLDLIQLLDEQKNNNDVVNDIIKYLARWTVETTGVIVFHGRIGALNDPVNKDIESILNISFFDELFLLMKSASPDHKAMNTEAWKRYENNSRILKTITKNLCVKHQQQVIDKKMDVSLAEQISTIESIFSASTHTASQSALSSLLLLARSPHVQESLYYELKTVIGDNNNIDNGTLQKLPYMRATLKEILRYSPKSLQIARFTNTDLILSNFQVPANSFVMLMIGLIDQNKYLEDAEVFRPERWLKSDHAYQKINPMLSLPFGYGQRSCMGRRLAENNLYLFLIHIIRNYCITHLTEEVQTAFNIVYHVTNPQDFRLERRV